MAIEKMNLDWKNKGEEGYDDSKINKTKLSEITDKIDEMIDKINSLDSLVSLKADVGSKTITSFDDVGEGQTLNKTFIGTVQLNGTWYNLINIRHRNGVADGVNFGLQIRKPLISGAKDFQWRFQNNESWSEWESLI